MFGNIPVDVMLFGLAVAAFFLVGLPVITSKISLPRRVEFEKLEDHNLTPEQTKYFARLDPKLYDLGFRPSGNHVATNMQGRALVRLYLSDVDPAIIMMNLLTSKVEGGGEHPMNYLEVMTRYRDGSILSTRNAEISEVLDQLPEHTIIEKRGLREPAELKAAHDRTAEALLERGVLFSRADEFESAFHEYHERWCRYQMDRGLLKERTSDPERLRPTVKTGLRGIANFLNPFADNFTPLRLFLVAVFGLVVPGVAIIWLGSPDSELMNRLSSATGFDATTCLIACLAVLFTMAGVVVGVLFATKGFIWSFLLTYVLLRLLGPPGIVTALTLSIWTGVIADWAARWRASKTKLA